MRYSKLSFVAHYCDDRSAVPSGPGGTNGSSLVGAMTSGFKSEFQTYCYYGLEMQWPGSHRRVGPCAMIGRR